MILGKCEHERDRRSTNLKKTVRSPISRVAHNHTNIPLLFVGLILVSAHLNILHSLLTHTLASSLSGYVRFFPSSRGLCLGWELQRGSYLWSLVFSVNTHLTNVPLKCSDREYGHLSIPVNDHTLLDKVNDTGIKNTWKAQDLYRVNVCKNTTPLHTSTHVVSVVSHCAVN